MSRYTITVTSEDHADPDATIGYDPPLHTFFLQAFPTRPATISRFGSAREIASSKRSTPCRRRRCPEATASCRCPKTSHRSSLPTSPRRPPARHMTARSQRCCDICNRSSRKKPRAGRPGAGFFLCRANVTFNVIPFRTHHDSRAAVSHATTPPAPRWLPPRFRRGRSGYGRACRSVPTRARGRCHRTGSASTTSDRTVPCCALDRCGGDGSRLWSA